MKLTKVVLFESGHQLPMYQEIHGHSYRATVIVSGNPNSDGVVRNFYEIENTVKATFDHKMLNNVLKNPTMENIAIKIGELTGAERVTVERPSLGESVEWTNFGIPT